MHYWCSVFRCFGERVVMIGIPWSRVLSTKKGKPKATTFIHIQEMPNIIAHCDNLRHLKWRAALNRIYLLHVIGHLRVPRTLTFQIRPRAHPFSWKWVLFAWKWKPFPYQRLSTYPRIDTEARGNSEMACYHPRSARLISRSSLKFFRFFLYRLGCSIYGEDHVYFHVITTVRRFFSNNHFIGSSMFFLFSLINRFSFSDDITYSWRENKS